MKKIAIIGSHGLYASYGGWDQLVNNLAEKKSKDIEYLIYNSKDTPIQKHELKNVIVKKSFFKASGFQGLFFDFFTILDCIWRVDTILFLGVQGFPIVPFLLIFKRINLICNCGGIEWERQKFGFFAKNYLRWCFKLSLKYSDSVILDNKYFEKYLTKNSRINANVSIIPYGGVIDQTLSLNSFFLKKYQFLKDDYFLSVSRSIEDNMIKELCEEFKDSDKILVLISNLSAS